MKENIIEAQDRGARVKIIVKDRVVWMLNDYEVQKESNIMNFAVRHANRLRDGTKSQVILKKSGRH